MRQRWLNTNELEIAALTALEENQFVVYYQPQYNHSTGLLVGAEALVRWLHPEKGLIPPNEFIPVFEENGFISKLDTCVFDMVCRFIRACLDEGISTVPISVNLSWRDVYFPGFIQDLEEIRKRYDVPAKSLRFELTESSVRGNAQYINKVIEKLHSHGYIVEMDDFGSGYSSLNILKDIDFDIIKLDMRFLRSESGHSDRGGVILSSVVRMMHWLELPTIVEGVETRQQADYLRSIGCDYIQGFLYAKPMPEAEYKEVLESGYIGTLKPQLDLIESMGAVNFWNSESLETLIFSNYVGGAAIFGYDRANATTEIMRVNRKYLQELGMNLQEKDLICKDGLDFIDEPGRADYLRMLDAAIDYGDEQEVETWRTIQSDCCGTDRLCIRSTVRAIGRSNSYHIIYATIRNVTKERNLYQQIADSEQLFRMASEQVNVYCWEYTIATKEMRPCFRCMRDLGLPALLKNYPESAIDMGVFPPEVADMYRDFMRQIDEGAPSMEAVIPLTVGRVPFHVRYTTEFDELGRPVKAYGSAALVVDG